MKWSLARQQNSHWNSTQPFLAESFPACAGLKMGWGNIMLHIMFHIIQTNDVSGTVAASALFWMFHVVSMVFISCFSSLHSLSLIPTLGGTWAVEIRSQLRSWRNYMSQYSGAGLSQPFFQWIWQGHRRHWNVWSSLLKMSLLGTKTDWFDLTWPGNYIAALSGNYCIDL